MMKNRILLILACLAVTSMAFAELGTVWRINKADRPWYDGDRQVRAADYNPATDHVVAVSRLVTKLNIVDAGTGADVTSTTLLTNNSGYFKVNMGAATNDGVVYYCPLVLNAQTTTFTLHRMATETTAATQAYNAMLGVGVATRIGDTLTVTGTGANTTIWCATNVTAGPHIAKFTTADGVNFSLASLITVGGTWTVSPCRLGIKAFDNGTTLSVWMNTSSIFPREYIPATDTIRQVFEDTTQTDSINLFNLLATVGYVESAGKSYVAFGPGNFTNDDQERGYVYDVTDKNAPLFMGRTASLQSGANTNGDGTGTVSFDMTRNNVIFNVTNCSLSANRFIAPAEVHDWNLF